MTNTGYLRRSDAAAYLKMRYGAYTTETLAKLACVGGGPVFKKFGPFPVYTQDDLDSWALSRMTRPVRSTSELATLDERSGGRVMASSSDPQDNYMEAVTAPSPFARAADEIAAAGWHVLPIEPAQKRPGEYRNGAWFPMVGWPRLRR